MTATPKRQRKYDPRDNQSPAQSKERRAERQRARYQRQKDFASQHGYTSWAKLATDLLSGKIKIVRSDNEKT